MTEVFKTNVQNKTQAKHILSSLSCVFAEARINFDLQDCDKILRVEGIHEASIQAVISDLNTLGFHCEILN